MDESKYDEIKKDIRKIKWNELFLLVFILPFVLFFVWLFEDEKSNNK